MVDPDPRNNGKGLRMLRQAGVSVEVGILQEEVEQFLAPYLAKPS
jgi:pyrimidine deaminase RibD-like protein